jgi:hypothetical protein
MQAEEETGRLANKSEYVITNTSIVPKIASSPPLCDWDSHHVAKVRNPSSPR